jgi:hypothetical protein
MLAQFAQIRPVEPVLLGADADLPQAGGVASAGQIQCARLAVAEVRESQQVASNLRGSGGSCEERGCPTAVQVGLAGRDAGPGEERAAGAPTRRRQDRLPTL